MKKSVFFLVTVLLLHSCANILRVTENLGENNDLAVLAGAGLTTINGGPSWKATAGGMVGADAKVLEVDKNSSLKGGVNISVQGANYELSNGKGSLGLTYLNLPVLYNYQTESGLYFEAGLQPALLLTAREEFMGVTHTYRDYMRKADIGLPLGGGYKINENMSAGARATFGLLRSDEFGDDIKDHNFLFVATLRYRIDFQK